ncbi:MAG: phage Gp37/Gp68 family protein [Nitrospirales bacterium]
MGDTTIEWTDKTWNPVSGCSHVSEGCRNCYAERVFPRPYPGRKFTDVQCHPERLDQPLHWKKPQKIFVNSMSDLFHEDVPDGFIEDVFDRMLQADWHTYQILTKRPERMRDFMVCWIAGLKIKIIEHIWLGVSVEDQETADERIPILLQTPAAVRWVSYEPALGPLDFTNLNDGTLDALDGFDREAIGNICDPGFLSETQHPPRLNWIVAGGESGPQARPAHPDWFRAVRDQCQAAGVPFFFKQWGEWAPVSLPWDVDEVEAARPSGFSAWSDPITGTNRAILKIGKKKAGRLLDGREWSEFPRTESGVGMVG